MVLDASPERGADSAAACVRCDADPEAAPRHAPEADDAIAFLDHPATRTGADL